MSQNRLQSLWSGRIPKEKSPQRVLRLFTQEAIPHTHTHTGTDFLEKWMNNLRVHFVGTYDIEKSATSNWYSDDTGYSMLFKETHPSVRSNLAKKRYYTLIVASVD